MKVAVIQPTYIPWLGYFALMDSVAFHDLGVGLKITTFKISLKMINYEAILRS